MLAAAAAAAAAAVAAVVAAAAAVASAAAAAAFTSVRIECYDINTVDDGVMLILFRKERMQRSNFSFNKRFGCVTHATQNEKLLQFTAKHVLNSIKTMKHIASIDILRTHWRSRLTHQVTTSNQFGGFKLLHFFDDVVKVSILRVNTKFTAHRARNLQLWKKNPTQKDANCQFGNDQRALTLTCCTMGTTCSGLVWRLSDACMTK